MARATFAANFFAAAGIEAEANHVASPEQIADAFQASGARLICVCGSDETYRSLSNSLCEALQQAGAKRVYIAGPSGGAAEHLRSADVTRYVFAGCDALAILEDAVRAAA
jgi:methylmalonyl-CoA mutase